MEYVCADCGHEQNSMNRCEECQGPRVILQSFAKAQFGPNWRKAFLPLSHPDALKQEDMPQGRTLVPIEDLVLIWWLDQPTTEYVTRHARFGILPAYLQNQVKDRYGRPGRGRLWIHKDMPNVAVDPWPDNDMGRRLGSSSTEGDFGGIVFEKKDLPFVTVFGGIVTNLKLQEV